MSSIKVIVADFTESADIVTEPRYQYDYGQALKIEGVELPANYDVHFANERSEKAVVVIGHNEDIAIPDEMFYAGLDIQAYIVMHLGADDGRTIYRATIPIKRRAMPTDEPATPQEHSAISEAVALLQVSIDQVIENVNHYPTIRDGYWYVYDAATDSMVNTGTTAHGNGIASVSVDPTTYTMTFTFDDGSTYETDSLRGPKGETGAKGDTGETGATGATPQLGVGTVTTLEPNEDATVTISGTALAPLLNFGLPRGQNGSGGGGSVEIEVVTDWDTVYDDTKSVRFLYGSNVSHAPVTGAQIIGAELNSSSKNRAQFAFRAGAGTPDSIFVRHAPNGTWGAWVAYDFDGSGYTPEVEHVTDWNTASIDDKPVRFLYGNSATAHSPRSGVFLGIELNYNGTGVVLDEYRVQILFDASSEDGASYTPSYVRHYIDFEGWTEWRATQGEKGEKGDKGDKGDTGPAGTYKTSIISSGVSGVTAAKSSVGVATLNFGGFKFAAGTTSATTAYQLVSALRPKIEQDIRGTHTNRRVRITTDGYIQPVVDDPLTAVDHFRGSVTYLTAT